MSERKVNRVKILIASLVIVVIGLAGCTRKGSGPDDPKQRLSEYISRSFAVGGLETRAELLSFLGGEAKTRLSSWSDDQFRQAFIESKRQFVKLAFREVKNVSDKEVGITYELTYLQATKGPDGKVTGDAKVTNKKLAQMVLDNGHWLIVDVRNIKELVEYKNEMSLP